VRLLTSAAALAVLAFAMGAKADDSGRARSPKGREVKTRSRAREHARFTVHASAEVYITTAPTPAPPEEIEEAPAAPIVTRDHGYGGFTGFALVVPPVGASLQGGGFGFRIHGAPALALELSAARAWGSDERGRRRTETPLALTALLYPSPGGTLQPYFPVGVFYDSSTVRDEQHSRSYRHFGGFVGCGLEVFLSRDFSVFGDARGMLRGRVGGDPGPEFAQGGRGTNLSAGLIVIVGAAWYPFGKY
jgi:hypothetical protein